MVSDVYKFFFPILSVAVISGFLHCPYLAFLFILLAVFICYFFRNPTRNIPKGENLIVSAADGKVVRIAQQPGDSGDQVISVFLNIFDVHVNRSPIAGELERIEYKRGKFKAAFDDEASSLNEQNIITISGQGIQVVVRQIAGLIARRVICWKPAGYIIKRGELFGLIRFGSRVDILLPRQVKILVRVGDRVKGGSSILGYINE